MELEPLPSIEQSFLMPCDHRDRSNSPENCSRRKKLIIEKCKRPFFCQANIKIKMLSSRTWLNAHHQWSHSRSLQANRTRFNSLAVVNISPVMTPLQKIQNDKIIFKNLIQMKSVVARQTCLKIVFA
jgi:hypothetical protein